MPAERRPSGGMSQKYNNNNYLLVRRIMIFIYYGQALLSQIL